jgi:phage-related protein
VSLHAVFWTVDGKSLAGLKQIQAQIDGVFSHDSLSDAAEPFHVFYIATIPKGMYIIHAFM